MLEIAGLLENSGDDAGAGNHESGDMVVVGSITSGFGEEDRGKRDEDGDRNFAGNRWPREETLALLKIRSDMDVSFRDSTLKGPLWEEVSRKLAELGFHRSGKKCKEKFENVFKYYKRTKDSRSSKPDGKKTYRFFDQLEALDNHPFLRSNSPENVQTPATIITTAATTVMPPTNPTTATSSSSGEEFDRTSKKKGKFANFFEKIMKEVMEKQEILHRKFLEAIEKQEQDRMKREEAWKIQELARLNKEHEILVQERSIAAAKDAAVINFLQKISKQSNPIQILEKSVENTHNFITRNSSRWPKSEVQALIRLRIDMDMKYQETGPKGALWEEISTAMKKLGYNRSSKRCKEKWENINKYFKKVKESNKKRSGDSKTCPYFDQLNALYNQKTKKNDNLITNGSELKPEEDLVMAVMNRQEQSRTESVMEDAEINNVDENLEEEEEEDEGDDEDEDEEDHYQIVTNNNSAMAMVE